MQTLTGVQRHHPYTPNSFLPSDIIWIQVRVRVKVTIKVQENITLCHKMRSIDHLRACRVSLGIQTCKPIPVYQTLTPLLWTALYITLGVTKIDHFANLVQTADFTLMRSQRSVKVSTWRKLSGGTVWGTFWGYWVEITPKVLVCGSHEPFTRRKMGTFNYRGNWGKQVTN